MSQALLWWKEMEVTRKTNVLLSGLCITVRETENTHVNVGIILFIIPHVERE